VDIIVPRQFLLSAAEPNLSRGSYRVCDQMGRIVNWRLSEPQSPE
jgi:hypothetical protein